MRVRGKQHTIRYPIGYYCLRRHDVFPASCPESTRTARARERREVTQKVMLDVSMYSDQCEEMQATALKELTEIGAPQRSNSENVNLFCEDCQEYCVGGCVAHGPPVFVTDTPVGIDTPSRAFYSIPHGLAVGPSGNQDGGLGVWCTAKTIPKGVVFGPYEGQIAVEQGSIEKLYSQMMQERNFSKPGAFDESKCNWMRFVNLAKTPGETNLILSQFSGKLYYKVCRSIEPAHELFIWHGDEEVNRPWHKSTPAGGKTSNISAYNNVESPQACSVQQKQRIKTEEEPDPAEEEPCYRNAAEIQSHYNSDQMKTPLRDSVTDVQPKTELSDPQNVWLENDCRVDEGDTLPGDGLVTGLQQLDSNLSQDEPCTFEHLLNLESTKAQIRLGDKNRRTLNPSSPICNKEKRFSCDYCERRFIRKEHLTMHLRTHTGEKPFACEECGRAFAEKWNLKEHRRTHTGVRPYPCRFCGKAFYRSSHLKVHLRRHTGEKPYKCDKCHQTFVDSSSLQKHRRFPSVCCKLENAIFVRIEGVEAMERHMQDRCDEASIENRQFNSSGNKGLVNGVLTDNGCCNLPNSQLEHERWSIPGDGLVNGLQQLDSNLSQDEPCTFEHLLNLESTKAQIRLGDKNRRTLNPSSPICNKEKRFSCDYCERRFIRKEHLMMHLRTHTGEKPFACEECGRAFAEKWNLKEHRRTHTGVRPYPCRFCGKAFYRSSHLKVHLRRHTGEKPYKCDKCHQTFVDSSSLQKHRRFPSACWKADQVESATTHLITPMNELGQNYNANASGDLQFIQGNNMENQKLCRGSICTVPEVDPVEAVYFGGRDYHHSENFTPHPDYNDGCAADCLLGHALSLMHDWPLNERKTSASHAPVNCTNYKTDNKATTCGRPLSVGKTLKEVASLSNDIISAGRNCFKCEYCGRRFLRKAQLTMHRRTHTGEKPYVCDQCGRGFAEKSNLNDHRRTHTGERPYACTFCVKTFHRSTHLKVHLRRHTGEKPYRCEDCKKTFVDSSSLQKHRRFPSDLCSSLCKQNPKKSMCDTDILRNCNSAYTSDFSRSAGKPVTGVNNGEKLDYTLISESGRYVKNSPDALLE
ncbi:uncharacterized protein [Chiloscyllium punctatum]|uniref:uncharacterized protein n=1 Tax=Chiloscyllium punctatum TaxID=137246 RepID=UPI003B636A22